MFKHFSETVFGFQSVLVHLGLQNQLREPDTTTNINKERRRRCSSAGVQTHAILKHSTTNPPSDMEPLALLCVVLLVISDLPAAQAQGIRKEQDNACILLCMNLYSSCQITCHKGKATPVDVKHCAGHCYMERDECLEICKKHQVLLSV